MMGNSCSAQINLGVTHTYRTYIQSPCWWHINHIQALWELEVWRLMKCNVNIRGCMRLKVFWYVSSRRPTALHYTTPQWCHGSFLKESQRGCKHTQLPWQQLPKNIILTKYFKNLPCVLLITVRLDFLRCCEVKSYSSALCLQPCLIFALARCFPTPATAIFRLVM